MLTSRLAGWLLIGAGITAACAGESAQRSAQTPPPPATAVKPELRAPAAPRSGAVSMAWEPTPSSQSVHSTESKPPERAPACNFWVELVPGGASLIFRAAAAPAEDVRSDARALVRSLKSDELGAQQDPDTFGMREIMALNPTLSVADTNDGARIRMTIKDGQVDDLRARILWHSADLLPGLAMEDSRCPVVPGENPQPGSESTMSSTAPRE